MAVNLVEDNYNLIRAAWTAMDQTYGTVDVGMSLAPINNASDSPNESAKTQPWDFSKDFSIVAVEEDPGTAAKFAIYKNHNTNTVMVVAMGTDGNNDQKGWMYNLQDTGLTQWDAVKDKVMVDLVHQIDDSTTIMFVGDSKGGALAQFALHDFIKITNGILTIYHIQD